MKKPTLNVMLFLLSSIFVLSCSDQPNSQSPSQKVNSSSPTPKISPSAKPPSDYVKLGKPSKIRLESFIWDKYKISFKLPLDMKEEINEEDEYQASNKSMVFQVFPWKDAKLSKEDVLDEGLKGLSNLDKNSLVIDDEYSGELEDFNGFSGYIIVGNAKQDGIDIYVGMLAIIDPKGDTNFISYITLDKGRASEDEKNLNLGADIFSSFSKVK